MHENICSLCDSMRPLEEVKATHPQYLTSDVLPQIKHISKTHIGSSCQGSPCNIFQYKFRKKEMEIHCTDFLDYESCNMQDKHMQGRASI